MGPCRVQRVLNRCLVTIACVSQTFACLRVTHSRVERLHEVPDEGPCLPTCRHHATSHASFETHVFVAENAFRQEPWRRLLPTRMSYRPGRGLCSAARPWCRCAPESAQSGQTGTTITQSRLREGRSRVEWLGAARLTPSLFPNKSAICPDLRVKARIGCPLLGSS